MKLVKVMKKYTHLFLFVVLLFNITANAQSIQFNAAANAQNIQYGNQRAAAPEERSRTGVGALQSLGRAATTLALMTAEIVVPVAPLYSPDPPATIEAPPVKAPVKVMDQGDANASATAISWSPISGRGFRDSVSKMLKGQTTGNLKIDEIIVNAATQHGVEPLLLFSVMHQESAFNNQAVSSKGARGLMQLMPATAARFGVKNIFDPEQNIHGAAQYLRFLLDLFDGNVSLALAGYNAGEGAVKKYGYAVPPYPETINYVRKIKRRYTNLSTLSE
jgi:soluble lytic murein transglycosylase-like protein